MNGCLLSRLRVATGTSGFGRKRKGGFEKECGRASFRAASQESRDRMCPQTTSAFVQADARPTCRSLADAGSAGFASGTATKCGTTTLHPLYPTLPILRFSAQGRMPIRGPVIITLGLLKRDQIRRRAAVLQTSLHFIPTGLPSTVPITPHTAVTSALKCAHH